MKSKRLFASILITFTFTISLSMALAGGQLIANVEVGKNKSVLCSGCHGLKGEGKNEIDEQPAYPSLAGQIPAYFIKSVYDYKKDIRNDPVMNALTKGLTHTDIANLAAYYESLK